ncbi:MAG: hypothetical protein GY768_10525 [Planctomycetaceae bacterium]|nr:hypothetical protein [Planctomycetaceae bacterium]
MIAFELVFRWVHILAAAVLVGGIFYQRFSLLPSLSSIPGDAKKHLEEACRSHWARIVMLTSGLLLVTGMVNAIRILLKDEFTGDMYPLLLMVKIMGALAIFWISAVLSGQSTMAIKFREKTVFWLNVNVLLAILIIGVAGGMKMIPRTATGSEKTRITFRSSRADRHHEATTPGQQIFQNSVHNSDLPPAKVSAIPQQQLSTQQTT